MLRKELLDTLRQAWVVLLFLLVVPLVYGVDLVLYRTGIRFPWYIVHGFGLLTVALAIYLAYGFFLRERREDAREYLLSLPVTKWKLFCVKFMPRLLILLPFLVVNQILLSWRWEGGPGLYRHPLAAGFSVSLCWTAMVLFFGFIVSVLGRKAWRSAAMLLVILAAKSEVLHKPVYRSAWSIRSKWLGTLWSQRSHAWGMLRLPEIPALEHFLGSFKLFRTLYYPTEEGYMYSGRLDFTLSPVKRFLVQLVEQYDWHLDWLLMITLVALAFVPAFRRMTFAPSRDVENRFLRLAVIPFLLVAITILGEATGVTSKARLLLRDWIGV